MSVNGWITTNAPIFARYSLHTAVTTRVGPGHQKTDSLFQPDLRSPVRDHLASRSLSRFLRPATIRADSGRRRQVLLWAQPCNDRHCGGASVPRRGLAGSSVVEGAAVMRRCGRVRLFMTHKRVRQESWQRIGGASPPRGRSSQPSRPRVMHEVLSARTAVKRSQGRPRAEY